MIESSLELLEANRLQTLYRYNILDSPPNEEVYDRLTALVARIFGMPFVMINLVDRERVWTKSGYGMKQYEYKRSGFFCDYTIQLAQPLVVPDATLDPRFVTHPSVIGEPHFRFYAGVPLRNAEGYNLGTLCLFDTKPRIFSAKKQADLQDLASVVVSQMELGLCNQKLAHSAVLVSLRDKKLQVAEEHFKIAFNFSAVGMALHSPNGGYILVNQAFCQMLGYSEEELLQTNFQNITHPDSLADNLAQLQLLNESQAYHAQFEKRYLHKDGHTILALVTVSAVKSPQGQPFYYIIQAQDITERKRAEQLVQGMLNSISSQLVVLDREGSISYVSKSWNDCAQANGIDAEQVGIGKNYLEVCLRSAQEEPQARQALEGIKAVMTGKLLTYCQEYQVTKVSGSPWFVMQVDPMPAEHTGVVITHTNDTERKQAEKVLQESEERFRRITETNIDGQVVVNMTGQVTFANPAAEQILRLTTSIITSHTYNDPLWRIMALDGGPFLEEDLPVARVMQTGEAVYNVVHAIEHSDGVRTILEVNAAPLRDAVGQMTGVMATIRNVTERMRLEEALHESQQSFKSAFTYSAIGMALISLAGKYLQVNRALCQILGYSEEELLQLNFQTITHPPDLIKDFEQIAILISGQIQSYEVEKRFFHKNGHLIWVLLNRSLIRDKDGQPSYFIAQAQDVTGRKEIERSLRESEIRYRTLAQNFPNGVIILFDQDLRFILVEGNGLMGVGLNNQDYVGKTLWEALPPDWVENLLPHYQAALAGHEYQFELAVSQVPKIYSVHIRSIKNEQGEITAGMLVALDITELYQATQQIQKLNSSLEIKVISRTFQLEEANQKLVAEIEERVRLEEELRVALQKEQELNELKGRFVSMTSHEFRTPLSTIRANAELLQRYSQRWTEEKKKELFQRIEDSTMHMTHMLDDVLLIGKAEAGKLEFKPGPLNLVNFCQTMIEEIKSGQGMQHEFNFVRNCDSLIALLDEKLMRQIVGNLLSNAVKYSPAGKSVYFELDYHDAEAIITIRDEGIGIPPEDLPHLFEVFHRAKNVGTVQGTGLGLAIVERSVQLHGGTITIESQVGIGTSFTVRLPVRN